jgi:hypothetical protein
MGLEFYTLTLAQFIFMHKSLRLVEREGESEPPEEKGILDI